MKNRTTRLVLSLLLCLGLFLLPACESQPGNYVPVDSLPPLPVESAASDPPGGNGSRPSNLAAYYPKELDRSQRPTLTWAVLGGVRMTEEAAAELNRRLDEQGAGYQVQFAVFEDFQKPADASMQEALEASLTNPPDLVTCGTRSYTEEADASLPLSEQPYANEILYEDVRGQFLEENLLLPLDSYLESETGMELAAQILWEQDWAPARYRNQTYGIPTSGCQALQRFLQVQSRVLEGLGVSGEEFAQRVFDPAFLQSVYDWNDKKPFLSSISNGARLPAGAKFPPNYASCYPDYWFLTPSVALDLSAVASPATLFLDSDASRQMLSFTSLCWKKGYLTSSLEGPSLENDLFSFCIRPTRARAYETGGVQWELIPLGESYALPAADDFITAIYAPSALPEQAFDLLYQCNTDESLQQLLAYGVEGVDYEVQNGQCVTLREDYHIGLLLVYGEEHSSVTPGNTVGGDLPPYEGLDLRQSQLKDLENARWSPWVQTSFDLSQIAQPLKDTALVSSKFEASFVENARRGTLTQWESEYRQALSSAGIDRVVEELNRQANQTHFS